jgi:hypothetical protein
MRTDKLSPATSGFVLAAAITAVVSSVLACAKDADAGLKSLMKSIAGHDWTTQGLFDLALFLILGTIFANVKIGDRIKPNRLIAILIGGVIAASVTLAVWFALT